MDFVRTTSPYWCQNTALWQSLGMCRNCLIGSMNRSQCNAITRIAAKPMRMFVCICSFSDPVFSCVSRIISTDSQSIWYVHEISKGSTANKAERSSPVTHIREHNIMINK